MSHAAITLAQADLEINAEGVPYSQQFGDVYHSSDGGQGQCRHVFIAGTGLPARWRGRECFTIVETGFGLGLNFLETWKALDEDPQGPARLHFVTTEIRPFIPSALRLAHARWPEHAARSRELLGAWPLPLTGFHRLHLAGGRIALTLMLGDALASLGQLVAGADAFFMDGFSPARNPDMWSHQLCAELARLARPGATIATWSVAGSVREGLSRAGFRVEKRTGFGSKREMLAGRFEGHGNTTAHARTGQREAMVLGAGLAGTACARRLAERGWKIVLLEGNEGPAREGSGNPLGLCAPLVNFADAENAQVSRAAFGYAKRHYDFLDRPERPLIFHRGVLRILRNAREADRYSLLLGREYPPSLARFAGLSEAAELAGHVTSREGIWFEQGMSLDPSLICVAQLDHPGIDIRYCSRVAGLRMQDGKWQALDTGGHVIAEACTVVLACATGCLEFAPRLRLEPIRGQITLLPADPRRRLMNPVSGETYCTMLPDGRLLIGATFQPQDMDIHVREADHAANIARLESVLPGLCQGAIPALARGRVGFRAVTPDRLPLVGAVATGLPGLFAATGLGARGLSWAPMCAELLASQISEDPLPLPGKLVDILRPDRFVAR